MIKTIIFDWNGVISDDIEAVARANCDIIYDLTGNKVSFKTWIDEISQDWRIFFRKHGVKEKDLEKVVPMMGEYYPRYHKYVKVSKNTKELLLYLKNRGIKLGVLSGNNRKIILDNMNEFGLNELFSFVVSGDDVTNHKPHPEPVEKAIKESKTKPEEIIYVDDMSSIFFQTKKLGMINIGFKSKVSRDFVDVDYIVKDMDELKKVFEKLLRIE